MEVEHPVERSEPHDPHHSHHEHHHHSHHDHAHSHTHHSAAQIRTAELHGSESLRIEEVDRIEKSAAMQLAALHGLNVSLIKKIRKSDAQSDLLLDENRVLEEKNCCLVSQLEHAHDDVRTLSIKEEKLKQVEHKLGETTSALVTAEVAVKKSEANFDSLTQERDALQLDFSNTSRALDTTAADYRLYKDNATKEKAVLETGMEERSRHIHSLTKDRDDTVQQRDFVAANLTAKEAEYTSTADQLRQLTDENHLLLKQSETKIADLDANIALLIADLEKERGEHDHLKAYFDTLTLEKQQLDKDHAAAVLSLKHTTESFEKKTNDYIQLQAAYDAVTVEKAKLGEELDTVTEKEKMSNRSLLVITDERDSLLTSKAEVNTHLDDSKKQVADRSAQLDTRNLAFTSLETDRNLLYNEKKTLENDYAHARDKGTNLEREKATLEMRVMTLEQSEKNLLTTITTIEESKHTLIVSHQRDLHSAYVHAHDHYVTEYATLRKELDVVHDQYKGRYQDHLVQCERDYPGPLLTEAVSEDRDIATSTSTTTTTTTTTGTGTETKSVDAYDTTPVSDTHIHDESDDKSVTKDVAVTGAAIGAAVGATTAAAVASAASGATEAVTKEKLVVQTSKADSHSLPTASEGVTDTYPAETTGIAETLTTGIAPTLTTGIAETATTETTTVAAAAAKGATHVHDAATGVTSGAYATEAVAVATETASGDRSLIPDLPTQTPQEPSPEGSHDYSKGVKVAAAAVGGTAVMVRTAVKGGDDEVDDTLNVPEAPAPPSADLSTPIIPGEGRTHVHAAGHASGIVSEEVMEEIVVDDRDGDNAVEEVDEEVPVSAALAAETRSLAMGVKTGSEQVLEGATKAGSDMVTHVGQGVNVAGAKTGTTTAQVANGVKTGVTFATETTTHTAVKTGTAVNTGVAAATDTARGIGEKAKTSGGGLRNLFCCLKPSKTVGDDHHHEPSHNDHL